MSALSSSTLPGYVIRYRTHAMDGVYSIAAGLALRLVVDAATFHDLKLSGILIGLWEGIVVLHYVNKDPTSSDPYLAYGVRLFVDFLVTESIFKLVVVLLWSTMGMVLADVAPAVWMDSGLQRQWNRFRRDLTLSARMVVKRRNTVVRFVSVPTVGSTARSDISTVSSVRSRASSVTATTAVPPSTIATTNAPLDSPRVPVAPILPPPPIATRPRRPSVPGTFPGADWSETDTDAGTSVNTHSIPAHVTIARMPPPSSVTMTMTEVSVSLTEDSGSFTTSTRSSSPTYSLEYADDPSATDPVDIPSEYEEELIATRKRETTPKQRHVVLPPTPSDTLRDWDSSQTGVEDVPPSPWMPVIPDHELEEWETIDAAEGQEEPPLPPPNDDEENVLEPEAPGSDASSLTAPSTIRIPPMEPSMSMPEPEPVPPPLEEDMYADGPEPPAPAEAEQANVDAPPVAEEPPIEELPPYRSGFDSDLLDELEEKPSVDKGKAKEVEPAAEEIPDSPPASPSSPSVKEALALRKEALELNKRIADLRRQRKSSVSDGSSATSGAAVIAALEIAKAEQELGEVNAKAEGAFVGAYNPPTASLYEFNTTGLTPEEAVRQTEARLGQLLLTPIPPPGTTAEDLAHDTPNRAVLKVVMQQSIKGRLVKQGMLAALDGNGLRWTEEPTRPNVLLVQLPVSASGLAGEDDSSKPDEPLEGRTGKEKDEDDDDAKEY
ncbi:hypothetical protein FB45DRAFT_1051503 [Roridomyces roridus]|uniref:Uncharacterized protein n=1 Tax=Roridomyces roridus TaxID=1738132 RepID=A0AAD7CEU3_9AGAR|nr:hypothetical protein FB45DRAFT_1051503 [Roridomyces roridus]